MLKLIPVSEDAETPETTNNTIVTAKCVDQPHTRNSKIRRDKRASGSLNISKAVAI